MRRMTRRGRRRRAEGDDAGTGFPVTPMLDMAFQLLAFFILTFQAPTREARIDLYLPSVAVALPSAADAGGPPDPSGDIFVRARAQESGKLLSLEINNRPLLGPLELEETLRALSPARAKGTPIRVALVADDTLRYEEAARLMGACAAAGVDAIRLAAPPTEGRRP